MECRKALQDVLITEASARTLTSSIRGKEVRFLDRGSYNAVFGVGNSWILRLALPNETRSERVVSEERRVLGRLSLPEYYMLVPKFHAIFETVYMEEGESSVYLNYISTRYVPMDTYLASEAFKKLTLQQVKRLAKQVAMLITCLTFHAKVLCSDVKVANMVADTATAPAILYLIDFDGFCYSAEAEEAPGAKRKRVGTHARAPLSPAELRVVTDMCCLQTAMNIVFEAPTEEFRRSPGLRRLVSDLVPVIEARALRAYEAVARATPPDVVNDFTFLQMLSHNTLGDMNRATSFSGLYAKCLRRLAALGVRPSGSAVSQSADSACQTSCNKLLELRKTILITR